MNATRDRSNQDFPDPDRARRLVQLRTTVAAHQNDREVGPQQANLPGDVAIHRLEYLLNAHIIGGRVNSRAFELFATILRFEAVFGLAGLVIAPILYAYAKAELRTAGWL